jgi:hypothetical protein
MRLSNVAVLVELFCVITIDYIALNAATRDLSRLLHVEAAIVKSKLLRVELTPTAIGSSHWLSEYKAGRRSKRC